MKNNYLYFNFMKKETIFDALMAANEKLLNLIDSVVDEEKDCNKITAYAKCVKTIGDAVANLASKREEIEQIEIAREVKKAEVEVNTVFDIVLLEDIVQRARERFKDDLHLIEHHQNSVEVIKKAKKLLNEMLKKKDEKVQNWHVPQTINDHTLFSMELLPHDAENLKVFQSKIAEVRGGIDGG